MFVDFNKVFKKKNQTEIAIPKSMVDYMNKSLPEGVKYISCADGTCIVTSIAEALTIGGFTFKPTKDQKRILGENYSQEDIFDYFYNIQEPLPLQLEKDGYILLNGEEFPVEKMAYNPLAPIKYVSGTFCIFPPKFPEPFGVTVGCKNYERNLIVSRVKNNSVSVQVFESSKDEPLYIQYHIDSKKNCITFNISYSLEKAKCIRDIVEATSIYNAFIEGNGIFLGQKLKISVKQKDVKKFDPASILFWEKVLEVEKYLGVSFIPPKENVDSSAQYLIEGLYQNFINKVPTQYNKRLTSVEGKWQFNEEKMKSLSGSIYFEFESEVNIKIFGVEIKLIAFIGVFNTLVEIQETTENIQKIFFRDESNEKKQFSSIIYFKNEQELNDYKKKDPQTIIALFRKAKNPLEI